MYGVVSPVLGTARAARQNGGEVGNGSVKLAAKESVPKKKGGRFTSLASKLNSHISSCCQVHLVVSYYLLLRSTTILT